jgi:hypothetical protein
MLILQPTAGEKLITIIPRSTDLSGVISLNIRRDGDGAEEDITNLTLTEIVNYVEVRFESTILKEDSTYYIEITKDGALWYRDKIYVTSQTSLERETNKHKIGNGTIYKPFSESDDNTYII